MVKFQLIDSHFILAFILSEYEYDPEMVKLHIIGGGGCLIRNFGTYDTDSVEIISDICATAKGYESLYMTQSENCLKGSFALWKSRTA